MVPDWILQGVQEPKSCLWVMKQKGLASTSFGGLNLFWGDLQKSNYNPAIVSGQTGRAGHFVLASHWPESGGSRATHADTRPVTFILR